MEVIADFGNLCGECPVWHASERALYWTDNSTPNLYRYDEAAGRAACFHHGLTVNAFRFNRAGGFVIANNDGIFLWAPGREPHLLHSSIDGHPCRINDAAADPQGRLLAGSNFYDPAGRYRAGSLFLIDNQGAGHVLDTGFQLANGLGFSPDGATLYFTDSAARTIYAYDYDAAAGLARRRRVFVQVAACDGLPDGLAVDAEGFVWSAQWYGGVIVRYDPDGGEERRIPTPAKQTSSLCFGGADLDRLFITSAGLSEPMPIMPPGYDPDSGVIGGPLYACRPGVRGKTEAWASIGGD